MTIIQIDTPKGQYIIPGVLVAENRADYYAIVIDGYEKNSPEWQKEVEWVMRDSFELKDWLLNNTDWEDWEKYSFKISDKVNVTDSSFWTSSKNIEIINSTKYEFINGKWIQNS